MGLWFRSTYISNNPYFMRTFIRMKKKKKVNYFHKLSSKLLWSVKKRANLYSSSLHLFVQLEWQTKMNQWKFKNFQLYHLQNNNMIKYKLTEKYQFLDTFKYPKSIVIIEIKCTRISIKLKFTLMCHCFDYALWLTSSNSFIHILCSMFIHKHFASE